MTQHRRRFDWHVWLWPIVLGLVSAIGLVTALLGDGVWDTASWIGLGLPVAVCGWFALRPR